MKKSIYTSIIIFFLNSLVFAEDNSKIFKEKIKNDLNTLSNNYLDVSANYIKSLPIKLLGNEIKSKEINISETINPVKQVKDILNDTKHKKVIFGTEGGLFKKKLNIPTIVCGPGSINQAHKPDEYIAIEQMEKGGKFIDKLISNYS